MSLPAWTPVRRTRLPRRSSVAHPPVADVEMQLPPPHVVRDGPPPDDLLLVVRGGRTSLDDINLGRSTADTWDQYGFFGVSVFGAADDDLVALSGDEPAIRRRAEVRVARVGHLRRHGFEVVA